MSIEYVVNTHSRLYIVKGPKEKVVLIPVALNLTHMKPKGATSDKEGIMDAANAFFKSIPNATAARLFTEIKKQHESFLLSLTPPNDNSHELTNAMDRVLRMKGLSFKEIRAWTAKHIEVPDNISLSFSKETLSVGHTREQTYISDEYTDLCAYAIMLKILAPFIAIYHQVAKFEKVMSKNTEILKQIALVKYPKAVINNPPYEKLSRFVEKAASNKVLPPNKVIDLGIGAEHNQEYVIALLLFKLPLLGVMNPKEKNLVSHLYSAVEQTFRTDRKCSIRDKTNINPDGGTTSMVEAYKDKEPFSVAHQCYMKYASGFNQILFSLGSNVNKTLVRSYNKALQANECWFTALHENVVASVLRFYIPIAAYDIMDASTFKGLCAITAALLKQNHPELATLMLSTAETVLDKDGRRKKVVDHISVIRGNNVQALKHHIPFYRCVFKDGHIVNGVASTTSTSNKHLSNEWLAGIIKDSNNPWIHLANDPDFTQYLGDRKGNFRYTKPMPQLSGLLVDLFLDLDNIALPDDSILDAAINGELTV